MAVAPHVLIMDVRFDAPIRLEVAAPLDVGNELDSEAVDDSLEVAFADEAATGLVRVDAPASRELAAAVDVGRMLTKEAEPDLTSTLVADAEHVGEED